jgi:hypothetical protein
VGQPRGELCQIPAAEALRQTGHGIFSGGPSLSTVYETPLEGVRLFRHHDHDTQLTGADRERLLSEGATVQGLVMHSELSADDRRISRLRIDVRFKDGQSVEFSEELANLYQPAPGTPEAQLLAEMRSAEQLRHPDRIPKIQLEVSDGSRIPVRYDTADRTRLVVDLPALQKRALHDYLQREQKPTEPIEHKPAPAVVAGPPWAVPTHCPNCGAPVDQAKAARDPDPVCRFCSQPIPVSPLVRS